MFMGTPENYKLLEIVGSLKSWIPKRGEHANMPRDFWMPDQSCRVCYECDSPFTVFNRRHHCRLCGRVFCAKCASNSIPVPSEVANIGREDGERIRVCNYCFKQQKQGIAVVDNAISMTSPGISPSPSTTSLVSSQSSCTCNSGSSVDSTVYSTGPYLHVPCGSCQSPSLSAQTGPVSVKQDQLLSSENPYSEKYSSSNRNNDEDYDYSAYRVHSNPSHFCTADDYYGDVNCNEETLVCEPNNIHHSQENVGMDCGSSKMLPESIERKHLGSTEKVDEMVDANNNSMEYEDPSIDSVNSTASEPVDFENNGLLWLPPEPEDEEDEREALLDDDDNAGEGGSVGEWGYLSPSYSFADGEYRNREKSTEEHRRVVKNIVDGHFKALIGQLLKDENLSIGDEDDKETWLEIITALSWEAATFLKPDMSQSEGMDPGAYVKVKCIPCGHFTESVVIKGVVCKKNVAHRRMTSKIDKPRLLILGGALEYQRVTNHLSSFDTLLQQEKDHLMMAVAKIDAHHPNILVVEKSVSRHAQEYLLAKDISLVLNVKRPLLQRIARCTGAKIVPSIDNLTTQKLGYCDSFRVEKFVEEHGKAGHDGKKLMKTLMFFEGCPKPLGCTILLKGANVDELKKVKHVVQYGVFAAYHLALETSFLADEGASLPDLPLKSPIKVALPDKPPSFNRSITLIPGFTLPCPVDKSPQGSRTTSMSSQAIAVSSSNIASDCDLESYLSKGSCSKPNAGSRLDNLKLADSTTSLSYPRFDFQDQGYEGKNKDVNKNVPETSSVRNTEVVGREDLTSNCPSNLEALGQLGGFPHFAGTLQPAKTCTSELVPPEIDNHIEELEPLKEDFSHSPSDHQSILVSLSTRCVWKGTVCERSRLFRIKYYGSFDLPLGRFLRDHLFDQNYRCHSCEMPSEAHVHCYTHQQGSLTISVKKLPTVVLPGEREGKIWMWHRCMQCPRANGFPPATRRVVMSDAARALSFGKFLELSFSNHAAASRVAGCGHSLHRDCLRFYGFGKMVACFRYAPINVHSVFLPPQKLEFNYDNQEWIHREVNEVCSRADSLFVEVFKALHKISEQNFVKDGAKAQDSGHRIAKLERILEKEKMEFEELLGKVLNGEVKADEPSVDVLEVNRLKRQLVLLAYLWDQRLVHITTSDKKDSQSLSSSAPKVKEKPFSSTDTPAERNEISCPGKGFNNNDSFLQSAKSDIAFTEGGCGQPLEGHKRMHMDQNQSHRKEHEVCHSSSTNISDQSNQEPGKNVKQVHSEGQFPVMENLSDTLDAAWTGEGHSASKDSSSSSPMDSSSSIKTQAVSGVLQSDDVDYQTWLMTPFLSFYQSFHKNFRNSQKHGNLSEYSPVYILSFRELLHQGGARVLLPVGVNDTVVPVYDDEPTSVISYALVSTDYHIQMSDAPEKTNKVESSVSLPFLDSFSLLSLTSFDEVISESLRGIGSIDESTLSSLGSRSSSLDQHLYTNVLQARITFSDDGPQGKVKYTVTCYYAKQFEALRKAGCSSELDFIRSLSRCKKWGAQGGKSNVFFAKTLDDRFIIKQVTKTELESFIKFAPAYFKYLSDAIASKSPTCLAKILGIYQVASKHLKGGKESKMDVLVMENLLFRRNITRLYDLKGSSRSRYNPDSSGSNKVLLDQNLIESMPTSPIFLGPKAKRLLERAVWNDTAFLASIDVMDYSLLAGVDEEKHELVLGIIDFMRQYTWDKHLETWVKASGILGGPKNASPTVISPEQYKKRFRKAMSAYFLMVPDRWSSSAVVVSIPSHQSNLNEGNSQGGASLE